MINISFVQFAKLLIESPKFGCSSEILTIVAILSGREIRTLQLTGVLIIMVPTVPNVWMRPIYRQKEADRAKRLLSLPGGDYLTFLNAYNHYRESNPPPASSSATPSKCLNRFRYQGHQMDMG